MCKTRRNILCGLLIALFMSYYSGVTLFPHTHVYQWGKVTHSHPYTPSSHHSHTGSALNAIDHFSSPLFVVTIAILAIILFSSKVSLYQNYVAALWNALKLSYNLRAPPAFC